MGPIDVSPSRCMAQRYMGASRHFQPDSDSSSALAAEQRLRTMMQATANRLSSDTEVFPFG